MIRETTMERLADELLDGNYKFQTFAEQVAKLLDARDEEFAERVRFKATAEFLDELDHYVDYVRGTNLQTSEIKIGMLTLDSNWIAAQFRRQSRFAVNEQINRVVEAIVEHMRLNHQKAVVGKERTRVRGELRRMFADKNPKTIYKKFFTWIDRPEMFQQGAKGALEFDEVLIPFCGESEYGSEMDRHMLYVAVTRAMHALTISYTGRLSALFGKAG
jgi:DNA helicase-2/ATP-dependent DNA helicase PcrA